ncbi:hypothetical protein PMI04_006205 [Sphingobium sp. AP49]|uniref:hypothetical protein n=1 Tax=Sphingobium sp. AP49 TaxID=1144307 RepID=UPI001EE64089|nr:hypothetical protein [Sphingobium sp. AP49]WHO40182.1 hypothetical protein PMI04_006205 [Sphingobium sp. AP49]
MRNAGAQRVPGSRTTQQPEIAIAGILEKSLLQRCFERQFLGRRRIFERRKKCAKKGRAGSPDIDDNPLRAPHHIQAAIGILVRRGIFGKKNVEPCGMTTMGHIGQHRIIGIEEDAVCRRQLRQPHQQFMRAIRPRDREPSCVTVHARCRSDIPGGQKPRP